MYINREELLQLLESVSPGLSRTNNVEQSTCFIFKDGYVITFNTYIGCRQKTTIRWEGAVEAEPLLSILRGMNTEIVRVEFEEGQVVVSHKSKRAGVFTDKDILLPLDSIRPPQKGGWKPLPKLFLEALRLVEGSASKNENHFVLTCVHLTPHFIEAGDSYQIARYKIQLPIREEILIRQNCLKEILSLDMREFCETDVWMHFRNPNGLVFSCRRWTTEKYDDVSQFLAVKGTPITLPKNIKETIIWAEMFSKENKDNQVIVQLRKDQVRVLGEGERGWSQDTHKAKYNGPNISFSIPPAVLAQTVDWSSRCEVKKGCLKITVGSFTYVTTLGTPEANAIDPTKGKTKK